MPPNVTFGLVHQNIFPVAGRGDTKNMTRLIQRLRKDKRGQDLIEYALMAGFVAVAAGAIMPNVASSISTIFNAISSHLSAAAAQGGS